MKVNIILFLITLFIFSCDKVENLVPKSIDYISSFSTAPRPNAITINKESGFIYVTNINTAVDDYIPKIQKFNREGRFCRICEKIANLC